MMQWMHRLSKSWVATLFMGALALSFVVWGIADVFTGMTSTAVATVGSTEIEQRRLPALLPQLHPQPEPADGHGHHPRHGPENGPGQCRAAAADQPHRAGQCGQRLGIDHLATRRWPPMCATCRPSRAPPANSTMTPSSQVIAQCRL